jgi:glc operon protein GlcG
MEDKDALLIIHNLFDAIDKLIPGYMEDPADKIISNGNVAVCIIDEDGQIYGRIYGTNKARGRQTFKIAWTKASQVWLTGVKTGEYERMVFNKQIEENANGIEAPDLIGWEGGQPLTTKNGTKLSVGFSGFRGVVDLEIMVKALAMAEHV